MRRILTFRAGICIGQQFALTEASYVTVRLLQRFDRIVGSAHELSENPIRSGLAITNAPARKVTLRMHEAKA
jgi:cytochrome P450